ncbi:probable peptidyl-tRNA hydrolase 2 isoform X2 [Sitophilus oryzae]|uniref:peptidyl-tRNA hydrolase n=1 Tax=Sitophilus oryzae TaxID=7048 RepID=A0A6J2Y2B7_SITOR|nr:probable peptidyl-tRNA hydrolase 2 isoform X2 [Sitophilus oryzae]
MSSLVSSSGVVLFSAGTLVGAMSTYFILRLRSKPKHKTEPVWSNGMEERYEFEETNDEVRLILGVRNDLKMQKGKVAAQCGHGAMAAYAKTLSTSPKLLKEWLKNGGTKIALRVESEEQLLDLDREASKYNVLSCIIRDAGQTQVAPGTRTVIAIGPAPKSILDKITGHLKLY